MKGIARNVDAWVDLEMFFLRSVWFMKGIARTVDALVDIEIFFF
jgi:hypothetical protein